MLTNVLRSCFSIGAKTKFEKARLQATCARDTQEPNEEDLQVILNTLNGRDMETRAQVGFATLVTKLETSESKEKWNYLLKNLIILDRCVESRFFLMDIQQLFLPSVDHFQSNDNNVRQLKLDAFVREYFTIIKKKGELYSMQNSSFNVEKSQKQKYFLKKEKITTIFEEIQIAQKMHEFALQVANNTTQEQEQFNIVRYVLISILLFFLNLQSSQYAAITVLLTKLTEMGLEQTLIFERQFNKFQILQESTVKFIKMHRSLPGFSELPSDTFYQTESRILYCIKDYQDILKTNRGSSANLYKKYKIVNIDQSQLSTELKIEETNQQKENQNQGNSSYEISAIKQNPSTQNMLYNPEIQEISLELENSDPNKAQNTKKLKNQKNHTNYFYSKNGDDEERVNLVNSQIYNNKETKQQSNGNINNEQELGPNTTPVKTSQNNNNNNDQANDENNNNQNNEDNYSQRKAQSVNFKLEKSQVSDQLSKNKSDIMFVGNLDNESLMMGYSTFIKKNKQFKISRLDFERTRLQKTFIDEDEEEYEFNYPIFHNYEQTWSRDYPHLRRNTKMTLIKQTNSYHIDQDEIQNGEEDDNRIDLGPRYFSDNMDLKTSKQYIFQINDDNDSNEGENKNLEVLNINVDWEKLDIFDEKIFNKFEQSFSHQSIKSLATQDSEIAQNQEKKQTEVQNKPNNSKKSKRKNKK
ncbi:hypothetical protein PPERSA_10628 [Pseudocohnilembus persalinus]|uniref:ENTH domain-containing protein n=1 Tax=Pseudocohnilembus persalinus TaxID=266149 RepID=A0A0V0QD30_PSEPJ|nr:hypothetical protein PPERSA_10628 [Pseudocohnilembus persalinus]|eukprot:KRX00129.1 hypothetical protein PPERSA_10628 [Pseudocohnilembus persalinus]